MGIRRYANPYEVKGAVRIINTGGAVRNVVINDVATYGVTLSGASKTVDRVTIQRAGMTGLGGHMVDNSTVTNSILSNNNAERFKDAPESGGLKFTASRTVTVKNVEANNNVGASGIWFDVSSYNLTIVNNTANGNTKYGIEVEVSGRGSWRTIKRSAAKPASSSSTPTTSRSSTTRWGTTRCSASSSPRTSVARRISGLTPMRAIPESRPSIRP